MSLVKYILQSCNGESRYRVIFTNPTYLYVGEVWGVQCSGIDDGCYTVMEDTNERLEELYGDDCTFIEYTNCQLCNGINTPIIETTDELVLLEMCDRLIDCDERGSYIYVPTGTTLPDNIVLYNDMCYKYPLIPYEETQTATDLTSAEYYNKCDECQSLLISNTPTPSITQTPSNTVTPSVTQTPSNTVTPSITQTPSNTVTPSITQTPDASPSPSVTQTPSNTVTPSVTQTPSNTVTPSNTATPSVTPTITTSGSITCYIGTTNGVYRYVDCCGIVRNGSSVGISVCVNPSESYEGVVLSSEVCDPDCNTGTLGYTFLSTGTCENIIGGAIRIYPNGGVLPYTIQNTSPGTLPTQTITSFIDYTGLTEGTYIFTLNDSSGGINQIININVNIDGCLDAIINDYSDATCGNNNTFLSISGDSTSTPYTYYIYRDGSISNSGVTSTNPIYVSGLLEGDYYAILEDYGGATAQTQTQTILSGDSVSFGFSYTGQSSCFTIGGAAEVTGVTGNSPFTYLWSNGQTGSTATGLTVGSNFVTVTDSSGCTRTDRVFIPYLDGLGIQSITTTQASCFTQNGTATITVTGGTAPYYFSGDTGQSSGYISLNTYTLTGLSGSQSVRIIDSGYCDITEYFTVPTTAGFTVVSVNTTNSQCSSYGTITIELNGTTGNITYTITGSTGNVQEVTTLSQSHTFTNLVSDAYTVGISSDRGCEYITTKTITNEDKFTISGTSTGTTCGLNNGSILITTLSGTTSIQYPLSYIISRINDGFVVYNNISSINPSELVSGLSSGTYEISVTDNNSCTVIDYITINQESESIGAILYGTPCILGNDGTATLQIISGYAPFNVVWSDNVPESQQNNYEISGLSGGTYTVTITSSDGCTLIKSVNIPCDTENVDDYIINTLCEQDFETTSQGIRGFYEMLNEAFLDLNIPGSNCELVSATFKGILTISGGSYGTGETVENSFYTGYTLNDYPTNELWETVVQGLLSGFTGITYSTNIENNTFTIQGICEGDEDPTNGAFVELRVEITLDVQCDGSRVLPTPSVTPTITPTNTVTPSVTLTPGVSPSQTPSVTVTPSNTPPSFRCELVVIGSSRQLTCDIEIGYSVTYGNTNLIVSQNYTI